MRAVTMGVHVLDVLVRPVEEIPEGQGGQLVEQIRITAAGSAGGTALTLAKLGAETLSAGAIGTDEVEIKLFSDGALVTKTETAFEIVKVGFEQFVANTARQNGLVYGLVTAFMALMTGWMASIVFRKD